MFWKQKKKRSEGQKAGKENGWVAWEIGEVQIMMPLAMLRTLEGVLSVWKPTGGGGDLGRATALLWP